MFICRDTTCQFFVSAYWDGADLVVVAKEDLGGGILIQKCAVRYSRNDLGSVMEQLEKDAFRLDDIALDREATAGLAEFIAVGQRRERRLELRVSPEMWN